MKGSLIKQHRTFKNMTLEELASGICSVSYLSKIEHDTINASEEIYRLLGERLKIKLIDINEEFDEVIYNNLHAWHEAAQLRDFSLMEELHKECASQLSENQNIELTNLFKIIHTRHLMTQTGKPLTDDTMKEISNIYNGANTEFKFFFHKTVGVHYLLVAELKKSLKHFMEAEHLMNKLPIHEGEVYFHLALAYSKIRSFVESTYYAHQALEIYEKTLYYQRLVDNYMIIAINYNSLGVHQIAEKFLLKVLKAAKYQLPVTEKRRIYHNLGINYINQEKYSDAYHYLQQAYEIDTKETMFRSSTIYLLALTSYYSSDLPQCWKYIEDGEAESEKENLLKYKHKFYILRHMVSETTLEDSFMEKLENTIIPDFRRLNEYKDYKEFVEMLGNLYYEKRMYKKAAMYYKEANHYRETQKKDLL